MIHFDSFELANGLRVIVHPDFSTPLAVVNVLYDVGARDEDPQRTGFAHLFEHLMFGGSIHIPSYDEPLQMAGGENNAYTTNDLTNYYIQLPAENIETAFWLESDRMLSLAFSPESLEVQRKVVMEEFKEHYINKHYGDVSKKIRELCYTTHPYQWQTIGKNLEQIETAQLDDVKAFFYKHYTPSNAILVVAGPVNTEQVKALAQKWFGDIPAGNRYHRQLPQEPVQQAARILDTSAKVPLNALYKAWPCVGRNHADFHATDLITDIMGSGSSSRLHQRLVKELRLFSSIGCYHFGSIDPGLVLMEGKLIEGVEMSAAEAALNAEVEKIVNEGISETECQKVKNKTESLLAFEDMSLMNRAINLGFYTLLGDTQLLNTEWEKYQQVTARKIQETATSLFQPTHCNTLHYFSEQ